MALSMLHALRHNTLTKIIICQQVSESWYVSPGVVAVQHKWIKVSHKNIKTHKKFFKDASGVRHGVI